MGVFVISFNLKDGQARRYEAVIDALRSIATDHDVWHDRQVLDSVALVVTDDSPEELTSIILPTSGKLAPALRVDSLNR